MSLTQKSVMVKLWLLKKLWQHTLNALKLRQTCFLSHGHENDFPSNGQFHNCQSWSFLTVHGQFLSNRLGLYCQLTIWLRKYKRKHTFCLWKTRRNLTRSKKIRYIGRSLKICWTIHWIVYWKNFPGVCAMFFKLAIVTYSLCFIM